MPERLITCSKPIKWYAEVHKVTPACGDKHQQSQACREACGRDTKRHPCRQTHTHTHTHARLHVPFDVLMLSCSDDNFIEKEGGNVVQTFWLQAHGHAQQKIKGCAATLPPLYLSLSPSVSHTDTHTCRGEHRASQQPAALFSLLTCWVSSSPSRLLAPVLLDIIEQGSADREGKRVRSERENTTVWVRSLL